MIDRDKIDQANERAADHEKRRGWALSSWLFLLDLGVLLFSVPEMMTNGLRGRGGVTFAAALLVFVILAVYLAGKQRRTAEEKKDFYQSFSEILEETFERYHPVMGADPGEDFFAAPLDYGFFPKGEQPEDLRVGGLLYPQMEGAKAEGFFYVRAYRFEEERREESTGEEHRETFYRIGQGLVWKIAPSVPPLAEEQEYIKIVRQRKSLGGNFVNDLLPGRQNRTVETGDAKFDSLFRVQSSSPETAEEYLTEQRRKSLRRLREAAGELGLYVTRAGYTVVFPDFTLMETENARTSGKGRVSADDLKRACEQLDAILKFLPALWQEA